MSNTPAEMYREAIVKAQALATGKTLHVSKTGFRLHYADGCDASGGRYALRKANRSQVTCMAMCWNCERPTDGAKLRLVANAMVGFGETVPTTRTERVSGPCDEVDCERPAVAFVAPLMVGVCAEHLAVEDPDA